MGSNLTLCYTLNFYSEQPCLLGMNVIPTLGIKLLHSNAQSLTEQPVDSENTLTVSVSLVQAETISGRKARFLDVCASTNLSEGDKLIFQPNNSALAQLGLSSADSLVTMKGAPFSQPQAGECTPGQKYHCGYS